MRRDSEPSTSPPPYPTPSSSARYIRGPLSGKIVSKPNATRGMARLRHLGAKHSQPLAYNVPEQWKKWVEDLRKRICSLFSLSNHLDSLHYVSTTTLICISKSRHSGLKFCLHIWWKWTDEFTSFMLCCPKNHRRFPVENEVKALVCRRCWAGDLNECLPCLCYLSRDQNLPWEALLI